MKLFIKIIILTLISVSLHAYEDQDIDGVADSKDLCPNTPFDVVVNEEGCPNEKLFPGKLTLQIGSDLSFNTTSDISHNLNLFTNYHYNKWDFSLSSSNYNFTNLNTTTNSETDLYFTVGYLFQYKNLNTKLSLGTKFAFMDEDNMDRDNDYYASINLDYYLSQKHNTFFYYNHTLSGQGTDIKYNDLNSYSLGTGYMFTPNWYSTVAYNYSDTLFTDTESYKALSWFNSYNFTKDVYATLNYAYTLNDSTSRHIVSLNLGVHFE